MYREEKGVWCVSAPGKRNIISFLGGVGVSTKTKNTAVSALTHKLFFRHPLVASATTTVR